MTEKPWVNAFLQGGLGNQLFQVAVAYNYSKKYDYELRLQRPKILCEGSNTPRRPYWDSLFSWVGEITENEMKNTQHLVYQENTEEYKEIPFAEKHHVCLKGYFQCEKYFSENFQSFWEKVRSTVKVPELITEKNVSWIAVHVRRGDYVGHSFHTNLDWNYYIDAISLIAKKLRGKNIGILWFSDEPKWVEKNRPQNSYKNFIVNTGNEIEQLIWMTEIPDGYVIANSSYSWWGAFIGEFFRKTPVCAPKTWFNLVEPKKWENIYCKNWIKL